jgi:hypothetical protein
MCLSDNDRTRPLREGRVKADALDLVITTAHPSENLVDRSRVDLRNRNGGVDAFQRSGSRRHSLLQEDGLLHDESLRGVQTRGGRQISMGGSEFLQSFRRWQKPRARPGPYGRFGLISTWA